MLKVIAIVCFFGAWLFIGIEAEGSYQLYILGAFFVALYFAVYRLVLSVTSSGAELKSGDSHVYPGNTCITGTEPPTECAAPVASHCDTGTIDAGCL